MSVGAGRAVTLGIRALGCVVNLGKLSGRDNIRIRESVFVVILVFKSYIYTISISKDEVALHWHYKEDS